MTAPDKTEMKRRIMSFKIVADSSADLLSLNGVDFASVPLTIMAGDHTYVDDATLDPGQMMAELATYKGRSSTACPNPDAYREAFGEADEVAVVTITSGLSGSYNASEIAKADYEKAHPERCVLTVDSLSAGPEMLLLIEKLAEMHEQGLNVDEMAPALEAYRQTTHLVFALETLRSLVNNGRVSPAVAAVAGLLNIRIVGIASDAGTLQPVAKCRGEKRTLDGMLNTMREHGFSGGKVRISHCQNEKAAGILADQILAQWPQTDIQIYPCRGLCSYYAEVGGMLVGYEGA